MAEENQNPNPRLVLERIFVKDMSMEVPNTSVFTQEWQPELDINLSSNSTKVDDVHYEVILTVTVNAKNKGTQAFIAEVHQAGIFLIEGIEGDQLGQLLGAYCPNVLFPFAREAISDVVTKGSFPQLLLAPVNFDAAYQESLQNKPDA
jgi:preprotein translocase subunit SecB